jgi:hypothetical protein
MVDSTRSRGPGRELGALGDGRLAQPRPDALASEADAKPPAAAQRARRRAEPATSGGQSVQITPQVLRFVESTI